VRQAEPEPAEAAGTGAGAGATGTEGLATTWPNGWQQHWGQFERF